MNRLLIVDDDAGVTATLRLVLEYAGYHVDQVATGRSALRALHADRPDLIILDLGLPDLDGWTVLERVRDISDVPVLVLSVLRGQRDKVHALHAGADDYVTKPFANAELVARITALLRRSALRPATAHQAYDDGTLRVDPARLLVRVADREVRVTPTEFRLLHALVRQPGAVLTAAQLLEAAWDDASGYRPQRVKFAVMRLRRKLGWDDPRSSPLRSVRGFGYRYCSPDDVGDRRLAAREGR